mmetsp:Transcript_11098/g.23091  ORF Transcript_11098/g.23091 Transcript_11098/m.23091 type:complete len:480 (+) Transcript_11098:181-1620(+)
MNSLLSDRDFMPRELYPLTDYSPEPYTPKPYIVPASIERTHDLPRYGMPRSLDSVVEGEAKDYIVGVVIGSIIILLVAVCWFMVIICLRIAGRNRVGFLAGRFQKPSFASLAESDGVEVVIGNEGEEHRDSSVEKTKEEKKYYRKVWVARIVFIISGLFVIVAGGLFYGKGVVAFKRSIDEVSSGLQLVQNTALTAINVTDSVLQAQDEVESGLDRAGDAENTDQSICQPSSAIGDQIVIAYNNLRAQIGDVRSSLDGTLSSFGDDLEQLVSLTEDVNNSLDTANIFFFILIAITCVIIILIVIMVSGVFFAANGFSNCFTRCVTNAVLLPIFIFFLFLSWVFATLFLVASLAGADFCVQPDQFVQLVLDKNADKFNGIIFGFIIYYVSGCTMLPAGEDEIRGITTQIRIALNTAHRFTDALQNQTVPEIQEFCGLTDSTATALQDAATFIHEATHVLDRSLIGVRDILSCRESILFVR